jgi:GT2 family glycosyltransferase
VGARDRSDPDLARAAPQVAVAVVSWNLRELLGPCLDSMKADADAGRAEVWVVDNASTDGSPDLVRERYPWVHLVASDENLGYGRAVNLVAERTTTPWIAPANVDIELRPDALETLLASAAAHPRAAVIAPRLELPDGSTQHSVHAFPTLGVSLAGASGIDRLSSRLGDRLCVIGSWDSTRARMVPWAIATFLLVRRQAFDAVGGFDPRQFIHSEDLALGWRLDRAGWGTWFEPDATVLHHGSVATRKAFGEDLRSRWYETSYEWMARERGIAITRAVAIVNLSGALVRSALLAPLARISPPRFARRYEATREWARVHRSGLRPRAELTSGS